MTPRSTHRSFIHFVTVYPSRRKMSEIIFPKAILNDTAALQLKYILQVGGKGGDRGTLRIALSKDSPWGSRDDTTPRGGSSRESRSENARVSSVHHRSSTTADTFLVHPWLYSTTPRGHLIHRPMIGWL